jgi:hypothetical protein
MLGVQLFENEVSQELSASIVSNQTPSICCRKRKT